MTQNKITNILAAATILLTTACGGPGKNQESNSGEGAVSDSATYAHLEQAFAYGLPLVLMDISRRQLTDPSFEHSYAPVNHFKHMSKFPDASFRTVVRPNADTYYSTAMLDLTAEPMVLSVPNTKGRYHLFPMLDAYTNVFASPGTRTTGNEGGKFLISGPGWSGQVPEGMTRIEAPTNLVWVIGRTQVNSQADGDKTVVPLQKQYQLSPLSAVGKEVAMPTVAADPTVPKGDPNSIVKGMSAMDYFTYLNQLLAKYPPPAADSMALKLLATLNVGPGMTFSKEQFSSEVQSKLDGIPSAVFAAIEEAISKSKQLVNGWSTGAPVIGTYGTDYGSRAAVSYFGLGANLKEDAIYMTCKVDAEGNVFNGANEYVLHFDKGLTPPVNAFWSLTMYDNEGYFIANPINRYAIGDRSNLTVNSDGSVDIHIQKNSPGKQMESNWLPAPEGSFNVLLRMYWPKDAVLKGEWTPPVVKKKAQNS